MVWFFFLRKPTRRSQNGPPGGEKQTEKEILVLCLKANLGTFISYVWASLCNLLNGATQLRNHSTQMFQGTTFMAYCARRSKARMSSVCLYIQSFRLDAWTVWRRKLSVKCLIGAGQTRTQPVQVLIEKQNLPPAKRKQVCFLLCYFRILCYRRVYRGVVLTKRNARHSFLAAECLCVLLVLSTDALFCLRGECMYSDQKPVTLSVIRWFIQGQLCTAP